MTALFAMLYSYLSPAATDALDAGLELNRRRGYGRGSAIGACCCAVVVIAAVVVAVIIMRRRRPRA
ncbi:hypothetical protein [Dactylosporangium sp. CA-139066]|uniref:hypothetical protein n=1 Tax=Dactylosporangium sp. CA-139066 TaxID=3239930 RepID=UPI003D8B2FFA